MRSIYIFVLHELSNSINFFLNFDSNALEMCINGRWDLGSHRITKESLGLITWLTFLQPILRLQVWISASTTSLNLISLGLWTMESSPQIRAKGTDSGLLPLAHATSTCQFPPPGGRTPVPDWMSVVPTSSPLWCSATGEKMVRWQPGGPQKWPLRKPLNGATWGMCLIWKWPNMVRKVKWYKQSTTMDNCNKRQWQSIPRDLECSTAAERYEIAVFYQATFADDRRLMHI